MGVDGALIALEVVAQDLLHELHARIDAARITGKRGQELEFGGGEVDLLAFDEHLVAGDVDHEVAEVQHLELALHLSVGTAEQGADTGDELARRERLDQVVVSAELEADDAVLDLALRRQHDDGHIGRLADGAAHTLARKLRQHQVQDDEVEGMLLELLDSALSIADTADDIVLSLKICSHCVADGLLILDQQNLLLI